MKPLIKWVGGKTRLLPTITALLPDDIENITEVFSGGLALSASLDIPVTALDYNAELIEMYTVVRDTPWALLGELHLLKNTEEDYYKIRAWDREEGYSTLSPQKRAARFIYLNKIGFNGLYRVNKSGYFNSPWCRNANREVFSTQTVLDFHLKIQGWEFSAQSFEYLDITDSFYYLDPPYVPVSTTANFTGYTAGGFGDAEQVKVRDLCNKINALGQKFMVSNSNSPRVRELYKDYNITEVSISRGMNNEKVAELLITNY